jgi:serine/threonine-protein phosphatase 5
LSECSKIVRKLAFEKAIAVDEIKKSVADSIDTDAIGNSGSSSAL